MKNIAASLSLLLLATITLTPSCKKTVRNEAYYEGIAKYIYAFTSGDIGRDEPIRVRFVNSAVGQDQVGKEVTASMFEVSPSIDGKAVWEDDRTILLQTKSPLPYGEKYEATVYLKKIFADAPREIAEFEFSFKVRELSFEVRGDGLQAPDVSNLTVQEYSGKLLTSDPVDPAALEKVLEAKQGNKTLSISWSHSADGKVHLFKVKQIERSNVRSQVNLNWTGAAIGVAKKGNQEVVIPALDEFVVLSANVVQAGEQYIMLNFSDPILPSQNLEGLIRLDDYTGAMRFSIEGNFVRVYPNSRVVGTHNLRVETGIKNMAGAAMKMRSDWPISFEDLKPAVRLVGRGAIIPANSEGGVIFPFEAVALNAVDVEVFKIYNSNILQYFQVNELEEENELDRVGKIIYQKKISLTDLNPDANAQVWQRYALDLKDIIRQDPGAIYQIRLAFRAGYTLQECKGFDESTDNMAYAGNTDEAGNLRTIMGGYRGIYFQDDENDGWWEYDDEGDGDDSGRYSWSNRSDPCKREYYNAEHFAKRNVFVSDLGLMAKSGKDGSMFAMVSDLHTTAPVSGVNVEFFNFQLQSIGKYSTDNNGAIMAEGLREKPFILVATRGDRRGYLRLADGGSLSLSRFDVAGVEPQKGLKGYLYGERGVWRPGDSLYLNFVLEDKTGKLPPNHPVSFELTDPKGSVQYRTVSTQSVNGVYALYCATRPDAPTGNWTAKVKVGGATFTKLLKIETVKPNRLKMDLDFGKKKLLASDSEVSAKLKVNWLHGAVGKNLKAKVEMQLRTSKTEFSGFKGFAFDYPNTGFRSEPQVLYDGTLDDNGQATVPVALSTNDAAPGKLIAQFKVRAFEAGGDFSTDNFSMEYFPYERFVGVSIPTDKWGGKSISKAGSDIQFACLDENGKPLANQQIEVGLYRCDWRWWWDEGYDADVAQLNFDNYVNAQEKATLTTDGRGLAKWKVKPNNWGRYLVRVSDPEGGHSAGDFFWQGYPEDQQSIESRNAAAMLPFSADKAKYNAGETVTLKVPASENGRILLTLETGTKVVDHLWFEAKAGDNLIQFKSIPAMAPTVYAHVTLLQPHAQTKNDLPIRMYGVMPINVENPETHLQAKIDMPDVLKPGEPFKVNIREASGKACAYTLAVVDEGLLDLTRFETPNPWNAFFAREALGVKTWDIYDYVLGAYGAELERVLSVGGDAINQKTKNAAQINRFKPAVLNVGPFYLEKGKTASHTLKLDNYVGSVRVMVVMSDPAPESQGAYGSAEKTCPVRKPLMILPTLPRVLGPNETLRLPVDVFAMEKQVKGATVRVKEISGLVQVLGTSVNNLNFAQPGEQMTYFDLKVGKRTGVAKFSISAQGGGESTNTEIEIEIRNPNPASTQVWEGEIEAGKEWTANYDPDVYSNINSAKIEVSVLPSINMSRHMQYLIRYPHGCVEQTTSAAFPQLYVEMLAPLSPKEREETGRNIKAAIAKLQKFQTQEGGFSYWPGGNSANDWGSSYAGHFLLEAKNSGYVVQEGMLEKWIDYQTKAARQWSAGSYNANDYYRYDNDLSQAYRLYTLALAGKAALGDMNRLREKKDLYTQSAYMLATAYAITGKAEVAKEIVAGNWKDDWRYDWCGNTYGSDLRDRSLILETYLATGQMKKAEALVNYICQNLGGESNWYWNTQSLSTAMRALAHYVNKNSSGVSNPVYAYKIGSQGYQNGNGSKAISTADFTEKAYDFGKVSVKNSGNVKLYTRLIVNGQALAGSEQAYDKNLLISVRYTDLKGNPIDVAKLKQGTDFIAEVNLKRVGDGPLKFYYKDLALSLVFPSGWEILNSRMNQIGGGSSSPSDYQDFRDDRVYTYFGMRYPGDNKSEQTSYRFQLNAAYAGRYYLPGVSCEAMYDERIRAQAPGKWVEVF